MVHKNVAIQLVVRERRVETPGYTSVLFDSPRDFTFEAGDWIDIEFADASLRGGKTYSLSSAPSDDHLMITFRDGISPYKRTLQSVNPGDKATITQYGNDYGFQMSAFRSSVLVAGGVGIAPFRSMLKEAIETHTTPDRTLVYFNQTNDFLFQTELESWRERLPGLKIHYSVTKDMKRKQREKLLREIARDTTSLFYIAGPEGMVEKTAHFFEDECGVLARNVRIDSFGGY